MGWSTGGFVHVVMSYTNATSFVVGCALIVCFAFLMRKREENAQGGRLRRWKSAPHAVAGANEAEVRVGQDEDE